MGCRGHKVPLDHTFELEPNLMAIMWSMTILLNLLEFRITRMRWFNDPQYLIDAFIFLWFISLEPAELFKSISLSTSSSHCVTGKGRHPSQPPEHWRNKAHWKGWGTWHTHAGYVVLTPSSKVYPRKVSHRCGCWEASSVAGRAWNLGTRATGDKHLFSNIGGIRVIWQDKRCLEGSNWAGNKLPPLFLDDTITA